MKTINTTLPVYDRIEKQIYQRVLRANLDLMCPTVTPRYRLPSMQWNVQTDDPGSICSIKIINLAGTETEMLGSYFYEDHYINYYVPWALPLNAGYDTFVSFPGNPDQFSAIKTTAGDVDYVYTDSFAITENESLLLNIALTLNSGTAPQMFIVNAAGTVISNIIRLGTGIESSPGSYTYILTATATDAAARIRFRNNAGEVTNYELSHFVSHTTAPYIVSDGTNEYFQYIGGVTIKTASSSLLPTGPHYLKFTTVNGYVYYSDWFNVDCVYENLLTAWSNSSYNTFVSSGTTITSAIETGADGSAFTGAVFSVIKGEVINIILFKTQNSGASPKVYLGDMVAGIFLSAEQTIASGLNSLSITVIGTSENARLIIYNNAASNFTTSEILVIREYSEKYIKIDFSNTCDIGDIYYEGDFEQTLWLESETLEPTFPYVEKGVENGLGRFVPAYQRQDKIWLLRTKLIPQYIVDVLHRLKLHDTIVLIDTVGNGYVVKHVDVEHDWQYDDKYYALAQVSLDFDEYALVTGCCS